MKITQNDKIRQKVTIHLGLFPGILVALAVIVAIAVVLSLIVASFAAVIASIPFLLVSLGIWWVWDTLFNRR